MSMYKGKANIGSENTVIECCKIMVVLVIIVAIFFCW